jgi:ParB family chromosome partitioning protein
LAGKNPLDNIALRSYDDIFKSSGTSQDEAPEKVKSVPLSEMRYFKDHPFKVFDDEKMQEMVESVKAFGVLVPALVRPHSDGGYEIVSGHRRHRACELAELAEMPVIVRNLTDDEAIIVMIDSNLQRETLLPSEKAFAYKMKLEAMKRQGRRTDLTLSQIGTKLKGNRTDARLAEQTGESRNQIQRCIRLTELLPQLLEMVDNKTLSFVSAADNISYLTMEEQTILYEIMERDECSPLEIAKSRLADIKTGAAATEIWEAVHKDN